jgi:uncharacterized protein (AIM24 family)
MFCVSCGSQIPASANFCVSCGSPAKRPAAAAPVTPAAFVQPASPTPVAAPPPSTPWLPPTPTAASAAPVHTPHGTKCSWCGATVETTQANCPTCGAALDLPVEVTKSGWRQLPGRKDMAKLQFGNSFCQIEGSYVPVADMKLAAEDSIYFTHHVLLWKDPQVNVTAMSLKGGWKRIMSGMPLIMTQAQGPGHIAFSKDNPGEMVALPLQPGQAIDVREHLFLVATANVEYDWFQTNIWFTTKDGDETETQYPMGMFMDRFTSPRAPGLLLLHAGGTVFVRELGPGQAILVKPTALIFKDPTVQMHLHFEHPSVSFSAWGSWSNRYLWLRLVGPGRIAIQSVFEAVEGESRYMTSHSQATQQHW